MKKQQFQEKQAQQQKLDEAFLELAEREADERAEALEKTAGALLLGGSSCALAYHGWTFQ